MFHWLYVPIQSFLLDYQLCETGMDRYFFGRDSVQVTHKVIIAPRVSVKVKVLATQSCDPIDYSLPGSSVHGILQARILENSFPYLVDLPDPGIELRSPALQADSLLSEPAGKPHLYHILWPVGNPH